MGKLVASAFCFAAAVAQGYCSRYSSASSVIAQRWTAKPRSKGCLDMASGKTPILPFGAVEVPSCAGLRNRGKSSTGSDTDASESAGGAGATADQIALAAGADASARAYCKIGGWQ